MMLSLGYLGDATNDGTDNGGVPADPNSGVCVSGGDLGTNCQGETPTQIQAMSDYCNSIGWAWNATTQTCGAPAGSGSGSGGAGGTNSGGSSSSPVGLSPTGSASGGSSGSATSGPSGIGSGFCGIFPTFCTMGFVLAVAALWVGYEFLKAETR